MMIMQIISETYQTFVLLVKFLKMFSFLLQKSPNS